MWTQPLEPVDPFGTGYGTLGNHLFVNLLFHLFREIGKVQTQCSQARSYFNLPLVRLKYSSNHTLHASRPLHMLVLFFQDFPSSLSSSTYFPIIFLSFNITFSRITSPLHPGQGGLLSHSTEHATYSRPALSSTRDGVLFTIAFPSTQHSFNKIL